MTESTAATTAPARGDRVAVRCENLVHVFRTPGQEVAALRGVELLVPAGEMVALLGPSGAGKTTLLWHLAGLMRPTAGSVEVAGHALAALNNNQLSALRAREVGILLQNPSRNLLPYATALDNLAFAARAGRYPRRDTRRRGMQLLESVGLAAQANNVAGRFSGGEQQRLALAVAVMNRPQVLLADEPTSQLDAVSAKAVVDLIAAQNTEEGMTVVAVTHDPAVAAALGRTVTIRDGRVGAEGRHGRDYLVVGRDGTLTLSPELMEHLPPGSLVHAVPHDHGVDLRRSS
jgi:ABC-type lipoprotein export system ATPase subunit